MKWCKTKLELIWKSS